MEGLQQYSMFRPNNATKIFSEYPELKKIPEFSRLSEKDLIFAWYAGFEGSPFKDEGLTQKELFAKSYEQAYPNCDKPVKRMNYEEGRFSLDVKTAISKMSSFKLGPRILAKKMVERVMYNYMQLIDIDISKTDQFIGATGEVDWTKKKAYIDSCAKINETLPKLIQHVESGFGVVEIEDAGDGINIEQFIK